ncbi:hypothetical protein ABZ990_11440 [Streptomyces sp. NPDC046203]|uniref:hypothetical protein n=1 Tax=Streptomyces sp. NPDC046203 TaxID=3154602 RepID=UPI0034107910
MTTDTDLITQDPHPIATDPHPMTPATATATDSDTDTLSRRVLRYAHAQGTGRSQFPTPSQVAEAAGPLPDGADRTSAARTPLPYGTTELLERAAFPAGRVPGAADGTVDRAPERALITAFGLQRGELTNPYFEHRTLPSVRSLFPVQAFVTGAGRPRVLDVHRHALTELPGTVPADAVSADAASPGTVSAGPGGVSRILLAGRYTRLPAFYGALRGTLTELELGISLRSLAVALELYGLEGRLTLPTSGELLAGLGLADREWSWPLAVDLADSATRAGVPAPAEPFVSASEPVLPDPSLDEIRAVNRAQAAAGDTGPVPLGPAIATGAAARDLSWAEVLWERGSGRMPRGLTGMAGRPRRVPAGSLTGAVAWAAVPPPGELLRRVAEKVNVTVAVQATDGFEDGVHRLAGDRLLPHRPGPSALAALEQGYGYKLAPGNGCDVRHASAVWFCSVRQRELVDELGPAAWTLAQYVAGWITQGLCLNAAAHGLYARPARAFEGLDVLRPLGLAPDETVLLSVISGTPRYNGLPLDLRL